MSSSDSDYSIDWLASDEEDVESEQSLSQRPDCVRRPTSTTTTTSSLSSSSSSFVYGGKRCPPSPPSSEDSQASSCPRQGFCEDGEMIREEEEEEDEERGVVGMGGFSTCSSPSSCMGSCDGAEERLGAGAGVGGASGADKPRHPWDMESPKKRLAHKRTRGSADLDQKEECPLTPFQTEKDRLFASKCVELRSYIPSLSSILNGLRAGRYRERLSSFQESVAMDRIQRIMGVLQNPHMGERYVNIILKVEEMLKSWFPHIKPVVQHADKHTPGGEMEPLSKKQKLSPGALARPVVMVTPVSGCLLHAASAGGGAKGALCVRDLTPPGLYSATNLKWLHTSPICSLTTEQAQGTPLRTTTMASMAAAAAAAAAASASAALPVQHDQDLTQDNSVSSSTDNEMNTFTGGNGKSGGARSKTDSLSQRQAPSAAGTMGRPPPGKINAPCLERLLKATESIITQRGSGGVMGSGWS